MVSDAEPMLRLGGDPFAQVLALDDDDPRRLSTSVVVTLLAYTALIVQGYAMSTELHAFAEGVHQSVVKLHPYELDIEQPPPPPPPPPEPEPPPPEPIPTAPPPPRAAQPQPTQAAPPPAAAEAGKVLTAEPDPDEPVDLTGNTFIQGPADSYAGGVTSSAGTSKTAVRDVRATGSGEGTGSGAPKGEPSAGPDLSAAARPASGSWDHCGFPQEAEVEQVNQAKVSIAVTITADGHAQTVSVMHDPGFGFGALAKRCALRERFTPAKNRLGQPIAATQVISINFFRR